MISVHVVIVHYQNIQDTVECIQSLRSIILKGVQVSICIINNSPKDNVKQKLYDSSFEFEVITPEKNTGFAAGNNIGIRNALLRHPDYILLLNNDTIVSEYFLTQLIATAESDKSIGIISPKIYFAPGYEYHSTRYLQEQKGKVIWYAGGKIDWKNVYPSHIDVDKVDDLKEKKIREVDFVTGCCMLVRRAVFKQVGLLDEKYFMYFEDVDFSLRVKKDNWKLVYDPVAYIWHKNGSSSGKSGSPLQVYYQTRNRYYFGFKYSPQRVKLHLLKELVLLLVKNDLPRKTAAFDFLLRRMGEGSLNQFI